MMKKLKNKVLKTITAAMGVMFVISSGSLDSPSWIPTILCAVSLLWLIAVTYAAERKEGDAV